MKIYIKFKILIILLLLIKCNGDKVDKKIIKDRIKYDNGLLKKLIFSKKDSMEYKFIYNYYKDGSIKSKIIKNDKGKFSGVQKKYYKNGNPKHIIEYKKGKKNGKNMEYYSDGSLKVKSYFNNGKKHNSWIFYYSNGNIKERQYYNNSQLINYKKYNKDGTQDTAHKWTKLILFPKSNNDTIKSGEKFKTYISYCNMWYDSLEVAIANQNKDSLHLVDLLTKKGNKLPKVGDSLAIFERTFNTPGKKHFDLVAYDIKFVKNDSVIANPIPFDINIFVSPK